MRDDYDAFTARRAEVLAVAPASLEQVEGYAARASLPFPLLADPERRVFASYDVRRAIVSLGQRPGLYIIDRAGAIRYAVLGARPWDTPANSDVLAALAGLPEPAVTTAAIDASPAEIDALREEYA